MSESNGSTPDPALAPRRASLLFLEWERCKSDLDAVRRELAAAGRAEQWARERVLDVLKQAGGPVVWGRTLYRPLYVGGHLYQAQTVHASDPSRMVGFEPIEFRFAQDLEAPPLVEPTEPPVRSDRLAAALATIDDEADGE